MRKNKLWQVFLLFLLAGIVYACMTDDDELFSSKVKLPPEVAEAKMWLESRVKDGELPWKSANGEEENIFTPNWEKAFSNEDADYRVTEVHLVGEEKFIFVSPECVEKYQETGDARYMASDIRLVIRTKKKTNERDGFIMVVYPDLSYLEANKDHSLKDFTYLKRPSDFSGAIFYHNMEGEFLKACKYEDGTAYTLSLNVETGESDGPELRYYSCMEYCYTVSHYTDWYLNGEYTYTAYNGYDQYCYFSNCYWVDDGNNSSNNNSSGSSGSNNSNNKTPGTRTDCPSQAATNSTTANGILNTTQIKGYFDNLKLYTTISQNEWSVIIDKNGNSYQAKNQGTQSNPVYVKEGNRESVGVSATTNTYLIAHSHPDHGYPSPSCGDAITLAILYKNGASNIKASVIFASDGSQYMIYVDNPTKLTTFCNNNSDFFEKNGSRFKSGTKFEQEYNDAWAYLDNQGYTRNDANAYALTRVLDKYDTGLKISKKEPGKTDFKEQKTEVATSGTKTTYSPKICQ